ncbi:MAG TPA: hypothetical protein DCS11_02425 [Syntrophus sp. (in: bacteria)]|nr:hypothetical protein [Syntrophus sp. (in: bacteria)]
MPDAILGLDLRPDAVHAVLVTTGFKGRRQVVQARTIPLTEETGHAGALEALFAEPAFLKSSCVLSLPAEAFHFRSVALPFKEPKKIRQALPFELEPLLHEPLERTAFDYLIAAVAERTELLVAVADVAMLEARVRLLAEKVRRLTLIDVAPVALARQLCRDEGFAANGLLLDVGASSAGAVFVQGGRVREIRTFLFPPAASPPREDAPGTPASPETAGAASPPPDEARTAPEVPEAPAGEADAQAREARAPAVEPEGQSASAQPAPDFLDELQNTLDGLVWRGDLEQPPLKIFLTGPAADTEALAVEISRRFAIPVEKADLAVLQHVRIDDKARPRWAPAEMNQALALALRPTGKSGGFTFDPRRLRARNGFVDWASRLKWVAAAVGAILVLAGVGAFLDYRIDRQRLDVLKQEVRAVFRQSAPDVTQIVDPVQQLRVKIVDAKKAGASLGEIHAGMTALDILREISALAPASAELLVTTFNADSGQITLKGEAKSFDAVDAVKRELERSNYLKSIVIGQSSQSRQGNKVEFEMRMSVQGAS